MSSPVATLRGNETVERAADVLAELGVHRLFVVDDARAVRGAVSLVDVVRALRSFPVAHPPAFPHIDDRTGVTWTDDRPFDMTYADDAPETDGILALIDGGAGRKESVVWVEATSNPRARLLAMIEAPDEGPPDLRRFLAHPTHLRFRAAAIGDADKRAAIAEALRATATNDARERVLR